MRSHPDLSSLGRAVLGDHDPAADAIVLGATRALLRVDSRQQAARVLRKVVEDLGGSIVLERLAGPAALRLDVSLGLGEPRVVIAVDGSGWTRRRLLRHLPPMIDDAQAAADQCDRYQRQALRATMDALTGVSGRAEIAPRLAATPAGDVVCLMDLDGFKVLNDTYGHAAGDDALRAFGELLRARVRDADFVGRYGGDEFLVVFDAAPIEIVDLRLRDLARAWASTEGHRTSVSIGVAVVDDRGAVFASHAADRALYRAKRLGKDRVEIALPEDYGTDAPWA